MALSLADKEGPVDKYIKEYLNFQKLQAAHLCVLTLLWASVNSKSIEHQACFHVFIAVLHTGSIR